MFMVCFFPISSQVHNFCKYAFCLKVIVLFQIKLLFFFGCCNLSLEFCFDGSVLSFPFFSRSVHVGLTFNYSLGLVKDVLGQFKE